MKKQKGGVFKRNDSRGHDLRIFIDSDPENAEDFFEEYEGLRSGYPPRRSVYYLSDREDGIHSLIPEFIHISQSIRDPMDTHSTLERNPFNIGWSDFLKADFTTREISRYCPKDMGPGKIRCRIITDRNGRKMTEYSFHSHLISKRKALLLLTTWSRKPSNLSKIHHYLPSGKVNKTVLDNFARFILSSMKYALLVFHAEKTALIKLESAGIQRDIRLGEEAVRNLNQSYYNFKTEWHERDYLKSPRYLAYHNYPEAEALTPEQIGEMRNRWRDEEYPLLPYPDARRSIRNLF